YRGWKPLPHAIIVLWERLPAAIAPEAYKSLPISSRVLFLYPGYWSICCALRVSQGKLVSGSCYQKGRPLLGAAKLKRRRVPALCFGHSDLIKAGAVARPSSDIRLLTAQHATRNTQQGHQ
ncbi:MAG: hypothetical protein V2I56_21520, partial [Desulfobacteraceae bacterium]|nr:hypothetical protein [Desulfobacteraceae bacterium]